nr:MAG TPA: hypothetical protein [Caudoviricetes sp.]
MSDTESPRRAISALKLQSILSFLSPYSVVYNQILSPITVDVKKKINRIRRIYS